MKKRTKFLILLGLLLIFSTFKAFAVSDTVYVLLENVKIGGTLYNGVTTVNISIYDAQSGGNALYNSSNAGVSFAGGKGFVNLTGISTIDATQDLYYKFTVLTTEIIKYANGKPSTLFCVGEKYVG